MTWRGTVTPLERLYGSLPYALPMAASVFYGVFLFEQIRPLFTVFFPFIILRLILNYPLIPQLLSVDFVVFLCLYFFVVRNEKIKHFVRFNTMQSLLLGIVLILVQLLVSLLAPAWGNLPQIGFIAQILSNTIFLGMNGACIYSIFQTIRGVYAEIPVVSEAAYYQIRY